MLQSGVNDHWPGTRTGAGGTAHGSMNEYGWWPRCFLLSLLLSSWCAHFWSSNSNYSLLGGLRAVAQTISYEVSLALILLSFIFLVGSYNLINFYYFQNYLWMLFLTFPLSIVWFTKELGYPCLSVSRSSRRTCIYVLGKKVNFLHDYFFSVCQHFYMQRHKLNNFSE